MGWVGLGHTKWTHAQNSAERARTKSGVNAA